MHNPMLDAMSAPKNPDFTPAPYQHPGLTLANSFQHLAHDSTPKANSIVVKADQVADEVGWMMR